MTEKPESMVERIAVALWNHEEKPHAGGLGWDLAGHFTQVAYRSLARAALEALKEPLTALEAEVSLDRDPYDYGWHAAFYQVQAMINTALEEGK